MDQTSCSWIDEEDINTPLTYELIVNNENVVKTDENKDLEVYSYKNCHRNDSNLIKKCRGLIFEKDTKTLISRSFPYTPEYSAHEKDLIQKLLETTFSSYKFYKAYEGTIIRLLNYRDQWMITTHRKLDAFNSSWGNVKSFGDKFLSYLGQDFDTFTSTLNKDNQYLFIILNDEESRFVSKPKIDSPMVYHISTLLQDLSFDFELNVGLPHPEEVEFKDIDTLLTTVYNMNCFSSQGVIGVPLDGQSVWQPDTSLGLIKILIPKYYRLYKVRGNQPNLMYRYLQVRNDKNSVSNLKYLYPDKVNEFFKIETILYDISKKIYNSYINRYIHKKYTVIPNHEFKIMEACHKWYLQDRKANRIDQRRIKDEISKVEPRKLLMMVKNYNNQSWGDDNLQKVKERIETSKTKEEAV
jgi:hypothetical protein